MLGGTGTGFRWNGRGGKGLDFAEERENWVLSGCSPVALSLDDEKVLKEEMGSGFIRGLDWVEEHAWDLNSHRRGLLLMETSGWRGDGQLMPPQEIH